MPTLERLNVYIPAEIKEWFKKESERTGVSMSSYISLLLSSHRNAIESQRTLEYLRQQTAAMTEEDFKNSCALANAFAEAGKNSGT